MSFWHLLTKFKVCAQVQEAIPAEAAVPFLVRQVPLWTSALWTGVIWTSAL